MLVCEVSEQAVNDLKEIYKYSYHQFGEEQAEHYYAALWDCFQRLAETPEIGRQRLEFDPPLRSYNHRRHVVFYDVHDDYILIVRVLHQNMEPGRHIT